MLPGRVTPIGVLFISATPPTLQDGYLGGIAHSPDGQVRIAAVTPSVFTNGFGLTNTGQLCVAPGGTIANYAMGLPFTSDGRLVTQLNQAPLATDAYVGGIRVGPLGGVYTTDVVPVGDNPWSPGFSGGFGNGS